MALPGSGCCCGIFAGMILSLLASAACALAIYLWYNPEKKEEGVVKIEEKWDDFKDGGDKLIKKMKGAAKSSDSSVKIDLDV